MTREFSDLQEAGTSFGEIATTGCELSAREVRVHMEDEQGRSRSQGQGKNCSEGVQSA